MSITSLLEDKAARMIGLTSKRFAQVTIQKRQLRKTVASAVSREDDELLNGIVSLDEERRCIVQAEVFRRIKAARRAGKVIEQ